MDNVNELPEDYTEYEKIDLQSNRKLIFFVNGAAIIIAAVMIAAAAFKVSLSYLFDASDNFVMYIVKWVVLIVDMFVYMILHEAIHGIFMKKFSGVRPRYGFTGLYAYAGSTAYFNKKSYIIIGLSPVVVWGVVLSVVSAFVPVEWFWIVYGIQVINISGAAGDFYVTYRMIGMPKDILVNDTGVSMTIYASEKKDM